MLTFDKFFNKKNDLVFLGIDCTNNGRKKNIKNLDLAIYDLAKRVTDKKAYFVLMGVSLK